ncbi:MAG: hypothetical protein QQN58_04270 [Nitrosopumilus sp.]|nr:hypothetical protein [Nitrososphaerota archaeon]
MTKTKTILGISLVATAIMLFASPAIAEAVSGFSVVGITGDDEIHAVVVSSETIEETGAYGYGIISSEGVGAILVTTTHAGILDSAAQTDASDASFHNHYVALTIDEEDDKCPRAEIVDITFDEPGSVTVIDNVAVISGPTEFESTHSLTGDEVEFKTEGNVAAIVSFTIDPVDSDGVTITTIDDLAAVCINDVTSAS